MTRYPRQVDREYLSCRSRGLNKIQMIDRCTPNLDQDLVACNRRRRYIVEHQLPTVFRHSDSFHASSPCVRSGLLRRSSGQLVEQEIHGGNPAVPDNDEISPGVSWRLTRPALYPLDPPAIAQFLGPGNWLISEVRVSSPDRARDAIDLVAATVDALGRVVEDAIFGEDVVDGRAPPLGVVFTEDIVKVAR